MAWLTATIFIPFFAPSLSVLAFGQAMCGIPWGVFQVGISHHTKPMSHNLDRHYLLLMPARWYQPY